MPTLAQSLHSHDLGHLRIIAEHWGIELAAPDTRHSSPNYQLHPPKFRTDF